MSANANSAPRRILHALLPRFARIDPPRRISGNFRRSLRTNSSCFVQTHPGTESFIRRRSLLVDDPVLHRRLARKRKTRLGLPLPAYQRRRIFAERRAVLESVAGAPSRKPDILDLWMPVDQKISVRSVFVLAYARFQYENTSNGD